MTLDVGRRKGKFMNTLKKWIDFWNQKVKQFTIWDVK